MLVELLSLATPFESVNENFYDSITMNVIYYISCDKQLVKKNKTKFENMILFKAAFSSSVDKSGTNYYLNVGK